MLDQNDAARQVIARARRIGSRMRHIVKGLIAVLLVMVAPAHATPDHVIAGMISNGTDVFVFDVASPDSGVVYHARSDEHGTGPARQINLHCMETRAFGTDRVFQAHGTSLDGIEYYITAMTFTGSPFPLLSYSSSVGPSRCGAPNFATGPWPGALVIAP